MFTMVGLDRFLSLLMLLSALGLESGCAALPTGQAATTPAPTAQPAHKPGKSGGKLSSRLQILRDNPGLLSASPAELGKALSLPAAGPGSIARDANGRIWVTLRLSDTSETTLQAIRDAGAQVDHVASAYSTLTAYIALADLDKLTSLSVVLNISEEVTPGR